MNAITTHVLDLAAGRPRAGLAVHLARREAGVWRALADAVTDDDGRVRDWPGAPDPTAGDYRLTFVTGGYYPEVTVVFRVDGAGRHHVPLLLSPFGYTTYRGS
ncbi:MAG TPA: hydroxyisourate hydrolase [Terriglobales bacterium]|nr:hydroxyisourate hydrolase [Terriglobales bacterium]